LNLYEDLLYIPFQNVKDRVKVVHDTYPHNQVSITLNIDTPLSLLKRVLDAAYIAHGEYTALTRRIRQEFFVPIEERIPGVSSRTDGYLNNVVGPTNFI
jgi:ACT domain-containing protein